MRAETKVKRRVYSDAELEAMGGRHEIEAYQNPQTLVMVFGVRQPISENSVGGTTPAGIDQSYEPHPSDRIELFASDGLWHAGFRAATEPMDGVDAKGNPGTIVWVAKEDEWQAARQEKRNMGATPWPAKYLRLATS